VSHILGSGLLRELGFENGFNLRTGGASRGSYASFNLGRAVGDEPAAVADNHARCAAAVGYAAGSLYEVSQVHGAAVVAVDASDDAVAVRRREADALCAARGAVAVGVRIADCVPVLLADASTGAVAAVHAGWRGTVAGVIEAAVDRLHDRYGSEPSSLAAAILPHIGDCCFEVGEEVAETLRLSSPDPNVVDRSRSKPHVDLAAIVSAKLVRMGLAAERIERIAGCTRCEPERFFSFRRDGKHSGRHLAVIVSASG